MLTEDQYTFGADLDFITSRKSAFSLIGDTYNSYHFLIE